MASITVVGVGGTGSWLIPPLSKFMNSNDEVNVISIFDHDAIEYKNIIRQNFSLYDIGAMKAKCIAKRYTTENVTVRGNPVKAYNINSYGEFANETTEIIIGCVDSISGRKEILNECREKAELDKNVIYIDAGNSQISGNIHIALFIRDIEDESHPCTVMYSKNFEKMIEDGDSGSVGMSCANMQEQSVIINHRMSSEILNVLLSLSINDEMILDMRRIDINYVKELIETGIVPHTTFVSFKTQYDTDVNKLITKKLKGSEKCIK